MKRVRMILLVTALTVKSLWAADVDGEQILRDVDRLQTFINRDFSAEMTLISEDPETGVERQVIHQYRRDANDQFLILIEDPSVQRGQGYLRQGDNLWFYDPESRKFSHTSLKESFQGTDARNSDFADTSLAEEYDVRSVVEATLGRYDVYILDLAATTNEATYPFVKMWVTRTDHLVLKTEDFSLTERLMRTSFYPSYARVGDSVVPTRMIFRDELVPGKQTQITLRDISVAPIADAVFTKAYIERANR